MPLAASPQAAQPVREYLVVERSLGIGRHVSGIADPFNGHIDEFRIAHVQRSDGWIETTWNNMSDPGAFAVAGAEEQARGRCSRRSTWCRSPAR